MNALSAREHVKHLVLGGGVAGLTFALEAANHGSVLVLTKRQRSEGSRSTPRAASPRCSAPTTISSSTSRTRSSQARACAGARRSGMPSAKAPTGSVAHVARRGLDREAPDRCA